jgi:hypothetical protein
MINSGALYIGKYLDRAGNLSLAEPLNEEVGVGRGFGAGYNTAAADHNNVAILAVFNLEFHAAPRLLGFHRGLHGVSPCVGDPL